MKIRLDGIRIKQPKSVIHNSDVVSLRYSPRRTKTLSLLQVILRKVALNRLQEKFWKKARQGLSRVTVQNERHRRGLKPFYMITKPLLRNSDIEDRKRLANFIAD